MEDSSKLIFKLTLKPNNLFLQDYFESNYSEKSRVILYADFNVLNYFYENKIIPPEKFELYPDSTAVYFITTFFLKWKFKKFVSTDFQSELLRRFVEKDKKIFFFGDYEEVLNTMINKLQGRFKGINIVGIFNGFNYDNDLIIERINQSNADVLFIGLGAGQQEEWICENYYKINSELVITVGGWFQYLSGYKKRAPLIVRKLNLEWLYKLSIEFPRIWSRYLIGVPLFFIRVLSGKIKLELIENE